MIVLAAFPCAMVPPVTLRFPFAVRFAPAPMVRVPLLEVTNPVTAPVPFQLPPVTPSAPAMVPPARLMLPLPVSVALPLIVPLPASVPLVPIMTGLAAASEPLTCKVPPVIVVAPR